MNGETRTISVVCIFSMAMAALESAVVVYLRALYYPDGFTVVLNLINEKILLVEIVREAANIIMLCGVGYLAGKTFRGKVAYFLLSFAVWDIFYYVWLKVFINWPLSLFDWDILFLIPCIWLGPVLAPVICSVTMVVLAVALLKSKQDKTISTLTWTLLVSSSAFILFTFMKDYGYILLSNGFLSDYAHIMQNKDFLAIMTTYIPESYSWGWFLSGEMLIVAGIIKIWLDGKTINP